MFESPAISTQFSFSIHSGGGDSGPGILGILETILTYLSEVDFSNLSFEILPGLADMANIHPLIVHFPIALLSSFFILELLATTLKNHTLHAASSWMLYFGTLGALASVAAGLLAEATVPHGGRVHELIGNHKMLGLGVAFLASVLSVWRIIYGKHLSGMASVLNLFLAAIMVGLLTLGADIGGRMVYKYGVGVAAIDQPEGHEHNPSQK